MFYNLFEELIKYFLNVSSRGQYIHFQATPNINQRNSKITRLSISSKIELKLQIAEQIKWSLTFGGQKSVCWFSAQLIQFGGKTRKR